MSKNSSHQNEDVEQFGIIAGAGLGLLLFVFIAPVVILSGVFSYLIWASYYEREERKWIRSVLIALIGYSLTKGSLQLFHSFLPYLLSGVFSQNKIHNILGSEFVRHSDKLYFLLVTGGIYLFQNKLNVGLNRYVILRDLILRSFYPLGVVMSFLSIPLNMALGAIGIDTRDNRTVGSLLGFVAVIAYVGIILSMIGSGKKVNPALVFVQSVLGCYFILYLYSVLTADSRDESENLTAFNLRNHSGNITIGRMYKPRRMNLNLSWRDINHHIHILGQPGAGKSILLRNIYSHQVMNGSGLLMVDLKADLSVREDFKNLASLSGRDGDFIVIDLSHPESSWGYNPLQFGNATELKDKIIGAIEWSEPHYKRTSEMALLIVLRGLVWLRDHRSLMPGLKDALTALSSVQGMTALSELVEDQDIRNDLYQLITENKKDFSKSIEGLKAEISLLVMSEFGSIFSKPNSLNMLDAVKSKKIILVNLDGQTFSESAKKFGRMLLGDLRAASGALVTNNSIAERPQFTVIVDEFSDIIANEDMAKTFVGFLNRCRGSGMGVIIAHQSLGDFKDDTVKAQVLDSTGTLFSFVTKDPETAEALSAIAGTKLELKYTDQISENILFKSKTGMGTQREVHEYVIHPNEFKSLDVGEAIYIAKKPSRYGIVRVNYIEVPTQDNAHHEVAMAENLHTEIKETITTCLDLSGRLNDRKSEYVDAIRKNQLSEELVSSSQLEI